MPSFDYRGCSDGQIRNMERWLTQILERLVASACPLSEEDKTRIIEGLVDVNIRCEECNRTQLRRGPYRVSSRRITFCTGHLNRQRFFEALLEHFRGHELDKHALYNHCFPPDEDAEVPAPTAEDWQRLIDSSRPFGEDECRKRADTYVIWDPCTGEKWINEGSKSRPRIGDELRANPPMPKDLIEELGLRKKKKKKAKGKKKVTKKARVQRTAKRVRKPVRKIR